MRQYFVFLAKFNSVVSSCRNH